MKLQKGFSLVEGLLIVLILCVVGFAGWFVWDRNNQDENKTTTQETQQLTSQDSENESSKEPKSVEEVNTDSTKTTNENVGYVVVNEWGVRIKFQDYEKVSYVFVNESGYEQDERMYDSYIRPTIIDKFLTDKGCSPGLSIMRYKEKGSDTDNKIGDYYYSYVGGPDNCTNEADSQLQERIQKDISNLKIELL